MRQIGSKRVLAMVQMLGLAILNWSAQAQSGATAAIDGVYRGTIGKQQIILEIGATNPHRNDRTCTDLPAQTNSGWSNTCFNNDDGPAQPIEGRYFYRRYGVAILVEGTFLEDGSLRVQEYRDRRPSGAEWRLRFHDGGATGFFCKCDVRFPNRVADAGLKITLPRVSEGFDPALDSTDPGKKAPDQAYYDLLLDFPLATGPETIVSGEIGYVMQTDERFKVSLPQLTRFPDVKVMEIVNRDLAKELDKARLGAAFCLQGIDFRSGEWEEKVRVAALSDVVLSIVRETSYFCGGPHPDVSTEPLVYDMRAGRTLDLKDHFQVQGSSAILNDGIVPPGPTHSLLLRFYRQRYAKPYKGCDKRDITTDTTIKMYFDQSGLVIVPELAYASRGCGPKTTVPYEELRPFLIAAPTMPFSEQKLAGVSESIQQQEVVP